MVGRLLAGIVLWCVLWQLPAQAQAQPLRVAVATNFSATLAKLIDDYQAVTNTTVQISSASTGMLYHQILHGAPFDIFLAADSIRPELLERQQLILENSRKTYAFGQLALWSASQTNISLNTLKTHDGRLAISNPKISPYGKAASQLLKHLALWKKVQGRLVMGNNIGQTFQHLHTGAVPLGLVAYSQVADKPQRQVVKIPAQLHQPIIQQLVILKRSNKIDQAKQFVAFLLSKDSQHKLKQRGYLMACEHGI
jgi:molybdate transport system substrate-binding protein